MLPTFLVHHNISCGMLGIRRVRSKYAGIRRCTFLNPVAKLSKLFSVCEHKHTLHISLQYAKHELNTLDIRLIS